MSEPARKVLILGLDGMAFRVLDPLLESGEMPVLASLAARTTLESVVPPVTPPAWSSFLTGKSPGTHGILDFRRFDPAIRSERLGTSRDVKSATVFSLAAAAGLTTGVVHLPMHYPPPEDAGFVVSGHETPSTDSAFTWPPELKDEVLETVPDYLFHVRVQRGYTSLPGVFRETIGRVIENIRCRGELARHFLETRDPDLFMVHFQSLDALLHFAYTDLFGDDERHELTVSCFREADRQIGRLMEVAGDRLVVALSDHGFGTLDGIIYPNVLLEEWGLLRLQAGKKRRRHGPVRRFVEATALRKVLEAHREWKKRRKAASGRRGVPDPMAEARAEVLENVLPLDWSRTKAYVPTAGTHAFVYLNLKGREPEGVVDPADYDSLRRKLADRFLAARHPRVSGPLFAEAMMAEDVWGRDRRETGPDLVLTPAEALNAHRKLMRQPTVFEENLRAEGTHRMDGVLFLSGPGVKAGARDFSANIEDVAPTVLRCLGLEIPDDMEGSSLSEPFDDLPPEVFCAPPERDDRDGGDAYDDEEARLLEEHLKGLGYL
ncbi:MAG: alkaline phosphatase family protein [Planctomycetota bacterium]